MKKATNFRSLLLGIAAITFLAAQPALAQSGSGISFPVTFEDTTNIDYALTDFGGNTSDIVADPTDANNVVAKAIKSDAAELWAGTTLGGDLGFELPVPFADGNTVITVRVWSPAAGTPIRLKVEDAADAGISVETEDTTTVAGGWQTLEFDFSNVVTGAGLDLANTYDKASIFFNFGTTGADAGEQTYYWDDVDFDGGAEPVTVLTFPVTFEDTTNIDYALTDFGGNTSDIVVDPTDANNLVAQSIKGNTAELWAGTTLGGSVGFDSPVPFSDENTVITIRVWSPTAGTPIRLKVEDAADAGISVETEDTTTVAGDWQTLEFDFSNVVAGADLGLANTYNKASIFFNFGTTGADAGEQTYYWDDINFEGSVTQIPIDIIVDGDFTGDALPATWSTFQGEGATADFGVTNNEAVVSNIAGTSGTTWHLQLNQVFSVEQIASLKIGEPYTISFDARSDIDGRPFKLFFGEDGGGFTGLTVVDTVANTGMQTYVFEDTLQQTFSAMKFSFELAGSNNDFIVDNVIFTQLGEDVNEPPVVFEGVELPVTFEDTANVVYALTDFGNNFSEIVVDPTNASNFVAKSTKTDSAQTWAGTTIGGNIGFKFPLAFSQYSTVMTVRVWSPTAGTPIKLKVEDAANGNIFVEKDVNTTVAQEWETLEFDFSNPTAGEIVLANTYDKASIFFNFGTAGAEAGEATYYWDDVDFIEQDPPLPAFGDNKILFVDGPNVLTPRIDGSVVEDVVEPGNLVHRITGGAFFENGYFWDMGGSGGLDFSQNIEDVDTVYVRVRINPADHIDGQGNVRKTGYIMISDVSNGTDSDLQWGIGYPLNEFYDNQWHDLALPLPKPTVAEHDSAIAGVDLNGDPLPPSEQYNEVQKKWYFPTAWNGSRDVSPNDSLLGGDPEWNKLGRVAIHNGNDASGVYYLDDVYIGSKLAVDLSVATALPDLPGGVQATSAGGRVDISWSHDASSNIFNYELYYSGVPIANIEDEGVKYIGSFRTSDALNYDHPVELPHPSISSVEYHYAVVPTTQYSIKSPTNFTPQSVQATGETMPYIFELTEAQELQIISDLENGVISAESWPTTEYEPFDISSDVDKSDASAKVWMAFGRAEGYETVYIYVEALDDDILAGPSGSPSDMFGTTVYPRIGQDPTWIPDISTMDTDLEWNYYLKDQLKIHFGTYDVDFATGTTNEFRLRGDKPDYFLSLQPKMSTESTDPGPDGMLTRFWVTDHNFEDPDVTYNTEYYNSNHQFTFSSLYENMVAEDSSRIGWRGVTAFDVNDLLVATNESNEPIDAPFTFPTQSELKYIPISFELWDKDSGDSGPWWEIPSHVISYPRSLAGGGNNEWEDRITMLGTAAMAGSGVSTSIDDQISEVPLKFELKQNYPNPFNPSTRIQFSLPKTSDVTINIYNVLGQRVATLLNNESYKAGSYTVNFDASNLSSGLYIYRIEAGSFSSAKKMMLIK